MSMSTTRRLARRCLLGSSLVMLGGSVLAQAPRAAAHGSQEASAGPCTVQNVAGAYGFSGGGTIHPNGIGIPEGPVTTVGILTFDGQGEWETRQSLMLNGHVSTGVSLSGTYTVNPDCSFMFVSTTGTTDAGVFVDNRRAGWFMETFEGIQLQFTMTRIEAGEKD